MDNVAMLWRDAQADGARGDLPAAEARFRRIVELAPHHAPALLQLSYLESMKARYSAARDFALRAAEAKPVQPMVVAELLARLRTFNEADAFHACLRRLPARARLPIPALIAIGAQLSYNNEQGPALDYLDEAVRADPDFPPARVARAQVLTYLGRFDRARSDLEACIARAPEIAQAWWLLSRLDVAEGRERRIDRLRALAAAPARPDDVVLLQYALHNELDAAGDHEGAWTALEAACRAKRARIRYDAAETRRLVDALIARMPRAPDNTASGEADPLFIIGMHRSGTTLLEDRLDRHPRVQALGELYDFTQRMRSATDHPCRGVIDRTIVERSTHVDLRAVGHGYIEGLRWRLTAERRPIDKLPSNFLNAGFICEALPGARLLHMQRDAMETCFSNLRELFSDACPYSYDMQELGHYFTEYRRLMAHWHAAYPGRILHVEYRRLASDTASALDEVVAFCGLEAMPASAEAAPVARGVATASAVQVRRAAGLPARPKWAPYARWLAPLQDALGDYA